MPCHKPAQRWTGHAACPLTMHPRAHTLYLCFASSLVVVCRMPWWRARRDKVAQWHLVTLKPESAHASTGGTHTEAVPGDLPPVKNKPLSASLPQGLKR